MLRRAADKLKIEFRVRDNIMERDEKERPVLPPNNDEGDTHFSQSWLRAMALALTASWSCFLVALIYGFAFLQALAILVISGLFVFILSLGFSALAGTVWAASLSPKSFRRASRFLGVRVDVWGSGQAGSRLANRHRYDPARLAAGVVEQESEAPTEPANWMQVSRDQSSVDRGRCFVLADTSVPQSRQLVYDLSQIGFDVDMCDDPDAVMGTLRDRPGDCCWSLLVVDLDFFEAKSGMGEVIDELQSLRMRMKSLSVIILSSEIGRDSYHTSRLTIADMSLVPPVSLKRLRRGIWDAQSNNMIWQGRVQGSMYPTFQSLAHKS